MGQRGPEPTRIDWDEVDKLISYQCTQREIADFFGISVDTLSARCLMERGEKLSDLWAKRKSWGKIRLRKAQLELVERGGPGAATMAIYLDKKMFPDERVDLPPQNPAPPTDPSSDLPAGKVSFEDFCVNARYPRPFAKQCEMRAFIMDGTDPRMLLGARGYGKTDYITILGVAYDVYLNGTSSTNLIISKSKTRNTAMLQEIASALKLNGIVLEKENASCIRIAGLVGKDHSVEALTIKSSMRGRHPLRVIMDDPVTEEDVSEATRSLVKRKYNEIMKLTSNVAVIGQPAHAYDLYSELRPLVSKLEVPHGSIPELDHDLEAQRLAGVDESSIQASYHLNVMADGSIPFASIKYVDEFPVGDSVAFMDPSEGGDYTAVSIIRMIGQGIVVEGRALKKPWYHTLDELVPWIRARGVRKLCFETNKFGNQPVMQLQQLLGPHGIGVVGKLSDSNKEAVIMAAGSLSHLIHLSRKSDRAYTDQVIKYDHDAKFDDAPDSLARGLEWIGLVRGKK